MSDEKKCPAKDVISMGPDLGGGVHPAIRHDANHEVSFGTLRILKEGQPLQGEALVLERTEGSNYNVVAELSPNGEVRENHGGPAMVASDAYRKGWDNIFGKRQPVGEA